MDFESVNGYIGWENVKEIEELIWKSQSGEERALEELLRIYEKLILRISKRYYFQDGETEDVIQECRIAFWQSVMSYKVHSSSHSPTISLGSFAYICINRKLASAIRKRTKNSTKLHNDALRRRASSNLEIYDIDREILMSKDDIEKEYIFKEAKRTYYDYLTQDVSEESTKIVQMREDGYSYREIGEELKISEKKVDNTLTMIRKKNSIKDILN